jgi:hypothetical protein
MGVGAKDLGLTFISMDCDDNLVFQGVSVGVITQMKKTIVPFIHSWLESIILLIG